MVLLGAHILEHDAQAEPVSCDHCHNRAVCASGLACPDFHGNRLDSDRRASGGEYRRIFSEAGAFNELQAPKVMEMAAKGYSYRRIAREPGLGKDTVMDIVKRAREGVT